MAKEFETRVLEIGVPQMIAKLEKLGAKGSPETLQRRWVFDIDPSRDEWIRLRDDGKKKTVTYKCKSGSGITETEEIEILVDDFEKTAEILKKMPFKDVLYQENRRMRFLLDGVEFTIDTWPQIPPFLEIEAGSEEAVREALLLIGFEDQDDGNPTIKSIYERYGLDLHKMKELKF